MGLKTTNYLIEEKGITLPQAYALVKKLSTNRGFGTAVMVISTSRENALTKTPVHEVTVHFQFDMNNENPYHAAYRAAKGHTIHRSLDEETQELVDKIEYMPFYGWEDDV